MGQSVRALVVGTGSMARSHLRALMSFLPRERVGVSGRNADATRLIADADGVVAVDLAKAPHDLEFVVFAVPPSEHLALANRFKDSDAVLLLEKPAADSVEDYSALMRLSKCRPKPVFVAHTLRASLAHRCLLSLLRSGRLGNVVRWADTRMAWRHECEKHWWPMLQTGLLGFQGIHAIDLAAWALDAPVEACLSDAGSTIGATRWADSFDLRGYAAGTEVRIQHSWSARQERNSLVVECRLATVVIEGFRRVFLNGSLVLDAEADWFDRAVRLQDRLAFGAAGGGRHATTLCTLQAASGSMELLFKLTERSSRCNN